MLRFEWDALHVGDRVLVHDAFDEGSALVPGVVAMVDQAPGGNDVGVRTAERDGGTRVRRPARLAVHLDPHDAAEICWRCALVARGVVQPSG